MSRSYTPHSKKSRHSSGGYEALEDRFLALAQADADVFWCLSPSGEMAEASSSWYTFTGQQTSQCFGRGWLDAMHPADRSQVEALLQQTVTSGQIVDRECHIRSSGGAYRLVRLRAIPVRAADGVLHEIIMCGTDITRQELAGQMSDAQVQLAVNVSGVGMWDWDLVTNDLVWTDQEKALFGLSPDTPISYERFLAAVSPNDRERVKQLNIQALEENRECWKDFRAVWPDGSIHWLAEQSRGSYDIQGKPVHLMGATIDITDLKQMEERITAILEGITNSFVQVDHEWRFTYVNRRAEEYAGQSRETMQGQRIWDLFPELLGTLMEEQLREAMATRRAKEFEAWQPRWQRWLEIHAYLARDGLAIYAQDITERKQAEEALRQSRDAFRLLTEAMPQLVLTASSDGSLEYASRQWYTYTGSSPEQTLGKGMTSFCHPDDQHKMRALWQLSLLTSQPIEVEGRLREGKTGEYRWFLFRAVPLIKPDGRVWKWLGTCTDIHAKKCAEAALRESEVRFRRLVQSNIIGITVIDLEGGIHEANDAFLNLLGYTREDLKAGRVNWKAMTPPEYQAVSAQAVDDLRAIGVYQPYEKEYETKDGRRVPVLVGGTTLRREGDTHLAISFVVDLSASKEIERQKDLWLAMTSHELKTPLAALRGMLQLTQRRLKRAVVTRHMPPEWQSFFKDLTQTLEDSVRQIDVQTWLINDLLDVSRITANTLKLAPCRNDLVPIVRQAVEDLRATSPERSLLLTLPEHTAVYVLADGDRIRQVVANYVTNALRYSRTDQPVHIGLTTQGDVARVWVRDHGPGLSKEEQAHLWQRFSQVKGVPVQSGSAAGLGLGLYICQMLIAQHQGEVGVESTPGEGSTFWFTLPLTT